VEERLTEYRAKRDFGATPEPAGEKAPAEAGERFVIQEHHARRLHWDLRLEHDGVLASWALPNGVPDAPGENRLAVRTEDHPLEYLDFEGDIPEGTYGAGRMRIWDRGQYSHEKWEDAKLVLHFQGERVQGNYAMFRMRDKDWMIHRMDPPEDPEREPMPPRLVPMHARAGDLPEDDAGWGFEIRWDGVRAVAFCEPGRLRLQGALLDDLTPRFPELRGITRSLGHRHAVLDGEILTFDADGRPSPDRLEQRMQAQGERAIRRRADSAPAVYVIYDLLYLEGRSLLEAPYEERRERLRELELEGSHCQVPAHHVGEGGALVNASRRQGLSGIVAKRLDAPYEPGRRGGSWVEIGAPRASRPPRPLDIEGLKGKASDYYARVSPVLEPHLHEREVTVEGGAELRAPVTSALVFGLASREVALLLHGMLGQLGLRSFAKTSGSGGLDVYVPLNTDAESGPFAKAVAQTLERAQPGAGIESKDVDVCPYSLRTGKGSRVSMPVTWEEVEASDLDDLDFDAKRALARVEELGDLFAPVLSLVQELPSR
jgi:bifunctional non-homologous end joining protein LigD